MSKGALVGIPPRKSTVNVNDIDMKTYYKNDRAMTAFMNTLSMLFPEGEQFFVNSVKHFRHLADTEQLSNEISGFIGQEAHHTIAHANINSNLKTLGYPTDFVDFVLRKVLTAY